MAPRAPGVHAHEEWKGMAQPVGLVVEPVVLNRLGIFPESATTVLADWRHGVALRLVVAPRGESSGHLTFLLYAEDEELMPTDSRYDQHYSVGGLVQCLRQDRADHQNAMEGPGAWATLMSLFGLVYDGGGSSEACLPARLAICSIRRLTPSWKAARQKRPTPMGRWCPMWAGPSKSAAFNTATGR